MSTTRNRQPFDLGRAAYLGLNFLLLVSLGIIVAYNHILARLSGEQGLA